MNDKLKNYTHQQPNINDRLTHDLDNYILQDKIGSGSYGKVYRVKDKKTHAIYAAKASINAIDESSEDLYMDISREVDIISKLNHPSVLKFILYSPTNFKQKPKPVIITEYASNGSLSHFIEHDQSNPNNPILDDTRKLIIIYGIASAMFYLHSHGILHRDLKPDNILLDDFMLPKVADFGLSKSEFSNNKSVAGTIKGTPMFMAPEIWTNGVYSKSADVYAFAIVVYELMTCKKPFPETDLYNLAIKVKNGDRPEFNVDVPESYKYLIIRCWSQDPASRPTFDEILNELRNDRSYLTEKVNEAEFNKYVKYIDDYKSTFNSIDSINPMNKIMSLKAYLNQLKPLYYDKYLFEYIEKFNAKQVFFPFKYFRNLSNESQEIVEEADSNNCEFQFEVGRNLIEGRNDFPIDVKIGLDYIKEAMKNGNKESLVYYINMLIKGDIIPQDHERAKKLIDTEFNDDKSSQLLLLGKLFKDEKKFSESSECFKMSMKLGNSESYYEYAELVHQGLCLPHENQSESAKYYKEAIKLNNAQAMLKYGLLINDENNKKDLIKKSADLGNLDAMFNYATIIENENSEESMKYLKLAADSGHIESMNKYGIKLLDLLNKSSHEGDKNEALNYFKKASDKGCFESMYKYGSAFANDESNLQSKYLKEAVKFVKIAADNGYGDAMGDYSSYLSNGIGVEIDNEEAIRYIKKGVENKSSLSYAQYAYMLSYGICVEKNPEEAAKYFKLGIEGGSLHSMHNYAHMLCKGIGFEVNYEEAAKYYKMAIDRGFAHSMTSYAIMLMHAMGIDKPDYEGAIKYLKMAIDKGESGAMCQYGWMLLKGVGVERNIEESIKYFKMSIEHGNDNAMANYGYCLYFGIGFEKNVEEAIKYYKMAIDRGRDSAMHNYARILQTGDGAPVDYKGAIKYYKMAIDKGLPNSMNYLANMYEKGQGGKVDINEAVKLYKKAIDKKFAPAMTNYANLLWNGADGFDSDKNEAIKYYKMAVEKNDVDALLIYGKILCYSNGKKGEIDEGVSYLKKAADLGNPDALYEYGKIMEDGKIVDADVAEARNYYEKAASKGHAEAQMRIDSLNDKKE